MVTAEQGSVYCSARATQQRQRPYFHSEYSESCWLHGTRPLDFFLAKLYFYVLNVKKIMWKNRKKKKREDMYDGVFDYHNAHGHAGFACSRHDASRPCPLAQTCTLLMVYGTVTPSAICDNRYTCVCVRLAAVNCLCTAPDKQKKTTRPSSTLAFIERSLKLFKVPIK